jgi:dTDP-4-dehydrorhamnose 3,5-epimerase-like enzyme
MDGNVQSIDQGDRGKLWILEGKEIPFPIKRIYTISGVGANITRGGHTHFKTDQYIFAVSGSCTLDLDDGKEKRTVELHEGKAGLHLPPMLWHTMSNFAPNTVLLVVVNLPYDEADYIRDYDEFKKHAGTL